MRKTAGGWEVLDEQLPALRREYSFGPGMATTLVLGMGERRLLVVSPATGLDEAAHIDLAGYGDVAALLAPNGMHHLGIAPWLKRWPKAVAYAAEGNIERLKRKSSAGDVFQPLSKLERPAELLIDVPAGLKSPDLLLRQRIGQRWLWYVNDLVMNLAALPAHPVFRLVFALSGAKVGLSAPRFVQFVLVADKAKLGRWLEDQLDATPPALVVFGHGSTLVGADVADRLRANMRARYSA